jgi:hypothetical protein
MGLNVNVSAIMTAGGRSVRPSRRRTAIILLAAGAWLSVIGVCLVLINRYSTAPGAAGQAPIHWPAETIILPDAHRPTLVLFAHPRCPCTRATLGELDLLMARVQGRLAAQVWFLKPENTAQDWTNTDLWHTAAAIPGVTVHEDRSGREAALFQAATSGQAVLYDSSGRLRFEGGITLARGHSGDNPGRAALAALVTGKSAHPISTPVFGCSLFAAKCPVTGKAGEP